MLQVAATFFDAAKAEVTAPGGEVEEIDVMVMTVALRNGAGELQFVFPLKEGAAGMARQAQEFDQKVNSGLDLVRGDTMLGESGTHQVN